ncbi:MAG: efflux RND transporter periplasmic adaptor subunit [Pirellulaceae bacterium]
MNLGFTMTPRYLNSFLLVGVAACCAAGGCNSPTVAETATSRDAPSASGSASGTRRIAVVQPRRTNLERSTTQPAKIQAFERTPIYSKLTGYVEEIKVDIGDHVSSGQTLIELWVPELLDDLLRQEAHLAQAESAVKQAEAGVNGAKAMAQSAEAKVRQSQAGIGRAEGEHERWKAEIARMRELADRGSITSKLVDETQNQYRAAEAAKAEAEAAVLSAQATAEQAKANILQAEADLVAAQANVKVAQAERQRAQTMTEYLEIKAPFDGVITKRMVDTGHYVHPASGSTSTPLLVIDRIDRVRVFVDVPEMDAPWVTGGEEGDPALIHVQSLNGEPFSGRVARSGWALDYGNRSLRTEIDLPNEDGVLRPGMYATASILLEKRDEVLTLPITAIMRDGQQAACHVVAAGKVVRKPVQLGLRVDGLVEITGGVDKGDQVVRVDPASLSEGEAVETIPDRT